MATLAEFTVESIIASLDLLPQKINNILITGGGCRNVHLMKRLKERLKINFIYETQLGSNFNYIESELIAYLSARSLYKLPYTFPSTTGVSKPLSGGKLFESL
jgi:anhydro-N-acetylmuramic acid kinase